MTSGVTVKVASPGAVQAGSGGAASGASGSASLGAAASPFADTLPLQPARSSSAARTRIGTGSSRRRARCKCRRPRASCCARAAVARPRRQADESVARGVIVDDAPALRAALEDHGAVGAERLQLEDVEAELSHAGAVAAVAALVAAHGVVPAAADLAAGG